MADRQYSLMIDTSGEEGVAALCLGSSLLKSYPLLASCKMGDLFASIESALVAFGLTLSKLAFLSVGVGPGSFLGTRIGVMAAKTISFAAKVTLVSFCSLRRFVPPHCGPFVSVIDGKSHGVYVLFGTLYASGRVEFSFKPLLLDRRKWLDSLRPPLTVLSPHLEQMGVRESLKMRGILSMNVVPDLHFLAKMAYDKFQRGCIETWKDLKPEHLIDFNES